MTKIKTYTYDTLFTPLINRFKNNERELKNANSYIEEKNAHEKIDHTYQIINMLISLIGDEFVGEMENDKNLSVQLNEDLVNEVMAF